MSIRDVFANCRSLTDSDVVTVLSCVPAPDVVSTKVDKAGRRCKFVCSLFVEQPVHVSTSSRFLFLLFGAHREGCVGCF